MGRVGSGNGLYVVKWVITKEIWKSEANRTSGEKVSNSKRF